MSVGLPLATTPPLEHLTAGAKLRLAGEIVATYGRVRWLMFRRELPDVLDELRGAEGGESDSMPPYNRRRLADAVVRTLRLLPTDSRCLMRSLVLLSLLERRGVRATLVIGVKTDPAFEAHAWVERDGRALLPTGNGEFEPLTAV